MRDLIITALLVAAVIYGAYKVGYNAAGSFYTSRIEKTEQAIKEVLRGSSQTLLELSTSLGVDDARDLAALQEIINASTTSDDQCRVRTDSLRSLDTIGSQN